MSGIRLPAPPSLQVQLGPPVSFTTEPYCRSSGGGYGSATSRSRSFSGSFSMGSVTSFHRGWATQRQPPGPGQAPAVKAEAITGDGVRDLGANVDVLEWGWAKAACDTADACHLAKGTTWRAASATGGMRLVSGATNEQDALGAAQASLLDSLMLSRRTRCVK